MRDGFIELTDAETGEPIIVRPEIIGAMTRLRASSSHGFENAERTRIDARGGGWGQWLVTETPRQIRELIRTSGSEPRPPVSRVETVRRLLGLRP